MKVVIDTNVLVSAALKDRGPERVILFLVEHPEFEWVVSAEILREYREVLGRAKFGLPEALLHRWMRLLESVTSLVEVRPGLEFPRDRSDAKFLECALSAGADYFVTGDRDFENAQRLLMTTILSVTLFEKHICEAWGRS